MAGKHRQLLVALTIVAIVLATDLNSTESKATEKILSSEKRWAKVLVGNGRWSCNDIRQTVDGGYISVIGIVIPGEGEEIMLLKLDENGREVWTKKFDTPGDDYPFCVQQTADGGFIIVGYTESPGKNIDAWLIKTDENGNEIWNKTFGGKGYDKGFWVQQTDDRGYIVAGYTSSYGPGKLNGWVIKTDENGNEIWNKTFGIKDSCGVFRCIEQTKDGGYIATGHVKIPTDIWLIKLDKDGNEEWNRTFGEEIITDHAYCVHQTSDGGYIVAGETHIYAWLIKTNERGEVEWERVFKDWEILDGSIGMSVQQVADGGFVIAGAAKVRPWIRHPFHPFGFVEGWLAKVDKNGNEEWSRTYCGISYSIWLFNVQQTSDGGYIIGGVGGMADAADYTDAIIIKTDSKGRTNLLQLNLCGIISWLYKEFWSS